ncbi:HWE histidine kinase domain-containing protein [Qipengyuania nanhaisediminis]|uniref:HWE histidine kinase domain-containing protein n=1 Tax=Qipengyuania nanhaisediminis TaxID=604088 RepID=UPI0038B2FAD2
MTDTAPSPLPVEFQPILDTVIDAVIVLSSNGTVVAWNTVAETTFGWSADEAIGRPLGDLIIPEQHREAHRAGMARLDEGEAPRILNQRLELPALCKDGRVITVELSITTWKQTGREFFIGFLRDIEHRRRAEDVLRRQLRDNEVVLEISRMAADAQGFEDSLSRVLEAICELTGWQAGHAFLVDRSDADLLHASGVWYEREEGAAALMKEASEGLSFRRGQGLPGEVLERNAPVWLSDINLDGNFVRKHKNFRGAFGFPLRSEGRVIAVLEFFSAERSSPDDHILLLAQALGSQLGRVLERSQTYEQREVLVHELNHRNKNLLTVVQSIARMTFAGVEEAKGAVDTFMERLGAMARAQDLLVKRQWSDSTMRDVIETALSGFSAYRERISIEGPTYSVPASEIQTTVLTIHELCTNALKYGALASDDGRIAVRWGYEGTGEERAFFFEWNETGCKLDGDPQRRGFGTSLLQRGLGNGSGSEVTVDYPSDGVKYRMTVPAPVG